MGSPQLTELDTAAITSVTAPSRGGTLADLVRHLEAAGEPCALDEGGRQAWIQSPRHVLTRFPLECFDPVGPGAVAGLLRRRSVWFVNYLQAPAAADAANCFDYVCRDAGYGLERLGAKVRRDVRRGLRSFVVRLCTWEEWAGKGFAAFADTERRHGNGVATDPEFQALAARWRATPFLEIWGAWQGDDLVAWMTFLKVDDWALVDLARSRTEALRSCPNNAVLYAATWTLLGGEGRRYVSYGTSSLQVGTDEASLHAYKLNMGYEAIPVTRVFACRPAYRPILESRSFSWAVERLAPSSALQRGAQAGRHDQVALRARRGSGERPPRTGRLTAFEAGGGSLSPEPDMSCSAGDAIMEGEARAGGGVTAVRFAGGVCIR